MKSCYLMVEHMDFIGIYLIYQCRTANINWLSQDVEISLMGEKKGIHEFRTEIKGKLWFVFFFLISPHPPFYMLIFLLFKWSCGYTWGDVFFLTWSLFLTSTWSICWSHLYTSKLYLRLPRWHSGKESSWQCRRHRRHGFDPSVRKIPWRRKW